jgi:hypothetical protein
MNRWISGAMVGAWALCGTAIQAADRFVGVVEGLSGETRVAVVVEGERWLVYVCGESNGANRAASRWWKGAADGDSFTAAADGATLSAERDGGKIVGALTTKDGASCHFVASKVAPGSRAGAYRATATGKSGVHVLSWIVDTEGFVVGCNHGDGKRAALKPAKLPPPKPVARRKPKPAEDAEPDAEEATEKPIKKIAKAPPKETEEADEEDAKPSASADEDDDSEQVVGKKVTTAKPVKAASKKPPANDEDADDDEKPAKKPAKTKPADDEDG